MDTEYLLFIVMIYLAITLYFIVILYARCKVIIINFYMFDSKNNSFSSSKSIFTKNVCQMLREEASNMS